MVIEVLILFISCRKSTSYESIKIFICWKKTKKKDFRKIWISRINAASRLNGISYSQLINKFKKSNIDLNRKMLSQIAILDASTFKSIN